MMPITQKGLETLKKKYEEVKVEFEKMPAIIGEAREKGDLKENAEYHAARERQSLLNADLSKLKSDITGSQVVDVKGLPPDVVTFGKKLTLTSEGNEDIYYIVGPAESDGDKNYLAVTSKFVKNFLGKKEGESLEVQMANGKKSFSITKVEYMV